MDSGSENDDDYSIWRCLVEYGRLGCDPVDARYLRRLFEDPDNCRRFLDWPEDNYKKAWIEGEISLIKNGGKTRDAQQEDDGKTRAGPQQDDGNKTCDFSLERCFVEYFKLPAAVRSQFDFKRVLEVFFLESVRKSFIRFPVSEVYPRREVWLAALIKYHMIMKGLNPSPPPTVQECLDEYKKLDAFKAEDLDVVARIFENPGLRGVFFSTNKGRRQAWLMPHILREISFSPPLRSDPSEIPPFLPAPLQIRSLRNTSCFPAPSQMMTTSRNPARISKRKKNQAMMPKKKKKASLDSAETECLVTLLQEHTDSRVGGRKGWSELAWPRILDGMKALFPLNLSTDDLKKIEADLRASYGFMKDIVRRPGFAFDKQTERIVASEDDWAQLLKSNPSATMFRNQPIPHYDGLEALYGEGEGKTRAAPQEDDGKTRAGPQQDDGNKTCDFSLERCFVEYFKLPAAVRSQFDFRQVLEVFFLETVRKCFIRFHMSEVYPRREVWLAAQIKYHMILKGSNPSPPPTVQECLDEYKKLDTFKAEYLDVVGRIFENPGLRGVFFSTDRGRKQAWLTPHILARKREPTN